MKRLLLRLLLVAAFAGFMKTAASAVYAGEIWQRSGTANAPADRGAWTKRKQLLQKDLRTAVQEAAAAVEESNDASLKTRLGDLDASAKALLNALETSKQDGLEGMVNELLRNLRSLKIEAEASSSGLTDKNPDEEKQKLQTRVDTALTNAREAMRAGKDKELAPEVEALAAEVRTVKSSIASAKSAKELELADAKVSEVEARSQKITNAAAGSWTDSLTPANLAIAASIFLSVVSLVALALVVFKLSGHIQDLEFAQRKTRECLESLKYELGDARSLAENVGGHLARVQDDLTLQILAAKRTGEKAKQIAHLRESASPEIEPLSVVSNFEPVAAVDPDPSFPALVSDYLNHIGVTRKRGVEADFRTNTLVQTADTSAPFMFVAHSDGSGAGIVLPKPRLQRGQEFSSYYKGYYHCAEPSAGNVYIVEPAQVERAGSGWRLRQKGRMEIR